VLEGDVFPSGSVLGCVAEEVVPGDGETGVTPVEGGDFVEWQKDVGDKTNIDEVIALTKDGEVKAPIAGSVVQEMSLQKGDYMPACTIATISAKPPAMKGLTCKGQIQVPLGEQSDDVLTFGKWLVELGDLLQEGVAVATVSTADGSEKDLTTTAVGYLVRTQTVLEGDVFPSGSVLGCVAEEVVPGDGETGVTPVEGGDFVEWQKDVGDKTNIDEVIALTKDGEVKAPIAGSVVQEMFLQKGDYMPACTIASISVKPGIKGLTPGEGQTGVGPDQDGFFFMWGVELGDEVPEGFGLAVIKGDDGREFNVSAQSPGMVVRMAKLKTGDRVNVPTFIATLVSPLVMPDPPVLAGRSSQSGYFVKYRKDVGEQAVAMSPVGDLMTAEDAAYTSDAPTSGELVARLPLEEGDYVKDGIVLVTVRKPTIFPGPGQVPVTHGVAGGFVRWDVDGGKIYNSNDSALSYTPYGPIPDESRFLGR